MTADRPTGLTVTLPLVWRGDELHLGRIQIGEVWQPSGRHWRGQWLGSANYPVSFRPHPFPTRAEAERAVEEAVMKALGGKDA